MEIAKFTPGPWTYSKYEGFGDTRFYVAQQEGAPYTPNYSDVATIICETVQIERKAIQEANARLIAAAPELLEALQDMLAGWKYIRRFHGDLYGVGWGRAQGKAETAIAKATGEQP